jgi:hypothetical protein
MGRAQCDRADFLGHTSHSTCWIMAFTLIGMSYILSKKRGTKTCIQEVGGKSALKVATLGTKWDMRTSSRLAGSGAVGDWLTSAGCGAGGVVSQEASHVRSVGANKTEALWQSKAYADILRQEQLTFLPPNAKIPPPSVNYLASYSRDRYFGVLSPGWSGPGLTAYLRRVPSLRMCGAFLPLPPRHVDLRGVRSDNVIRSYQMAPLVVVIRNQLYLWFRNIMCHAVDSVENFKIYTLLMLY